MQTNMAAHPRKEPCSADSIRVVSPYCSSRSGHLTNISFQTVNRIELVPRNLIRIYVRFKGPMKNLGARASEVPRPHPWCMTLFLRTCFEGRARAQARPSGKVPSLFLDVLEFRA